MSQPVSEGVIDQAINGILIEFEIRSKYEAL